MKLSKPQQTVSDSDTRFRVMIAGRRFGKTYLSINEMAKFARIPDRKVLYIAPSYRMAKQIIWGELKKRLIAVNWVRKINETELSINLVNGSEILLRSADNYDSIRGIGADFVVFDEFADISVETWTEVIRPALSDRQGHALFIGTPKGKGNWSFDLYNRGLEEQDDWQSWIFTTLDGGNVEQKEIDSAMSDLDARTFRQEYLASFETYSNIIYYNFSRERLEENTLGEKDMILIGMDFNINPMSAVIGKWNGKKLSIFDEICIYGSNTQEICDEIRDRYPERKVTIYPDASGGHGKTSGTSDHNIMKQNGFAVKSPFKNPPVKDRINSVNAAFLNAKGDNRLIIDPSCKRTIECLEKHTYTGNTRQPDKNSGFDHQTDALGYLVHSLMPVRVPKTKTKKPDYFGA